jgi:hypothetical protein
MLLAGALLACAVVAVVFILRGAKRDVPADVSDEA